MENISRFFSNTFKYILYISMFFIWINYYYRDVITSLVLSVIISIITDKIISIFVKRSRHNAIVKSKEKKLISDFSTQFLCSTKYQNINYFSSLFSNPSTKKSKDCFIIKDTTFIPYYTTCKIDESDIMAIYRTFNIKTKNLVVLCKDITDGAKSFAKSISNYNFVVLNEYDVYFKFLKPLNASLPSIISFKETKKLKIKEYINIALNKNHSKGYFTSGFVILISSIFIRYKIYYIVFAFILFVLAYFSYFNVWFNKPEDNNFI